MLFQNLSIINIFVAFVVMMSVGMMWYSPSVFGNKWMAALGKKQDDMSGMTKAMVFGSLVTLGQVVVVAIIFAYAGIHDPTSGAIMGFILGAGISGTNALSRYVWEGSSWTITWINGGHAIVSKVLTGLILGWGV